MTGEMLQKIEKGAGSLAWSPDGMRLTSGYNIWNANTVELLLSREEDGEYHINSVAYSPDGTRIAKGSLDEIVKIWNANTDEVILTLEDDAITGIRKWVHSVAWSPEGTKVASGAGGYHTSDDNSIHIWDPMTGALLNTLKGHNASVQSVAWSPDGTKLASGSYDHTIRIWDVTATMSGNRPPTAKPTQQPTSAPSAPPAATPVTGNDVVIFSEGDHEKKGVDIKVYKTVCPSCNFIDARLTDGELANGAHYYVHGKDSSDYWNVIGGIDMMDLSLRVESASQPNRVGTFGLNVYSKYGLDIGIQNRGTGWFGMYWGNISATPYYFETETKYRTSRFVSFLVVAKLEDDKDKVIAYFNFYDRHFTLLNQEILTLSVEKGVF